MPRSVFHQKKQLLGEDWFHRYRYLITVRFSLLRASRLSHTSFQLTNNHKLYLIVCVPHLLSLSLKKKIFQSKTHRSVSLPVFVQLHYKPEV